MKTDPRHDMTNVQSPFPVFLAGHGLSSAIYTLTALDVDVVLYIGPRVHVR